MTYSDKRGGPGKSNRITRGQAFRLAKWAEENVELARLLTRAELAERASSDLGFTVSRVMLSHTVRDCGIELPAPRRKRRDADTTGKHRRNVAGLAREVLTLRRLVSYLYGALGEGIPPELSPDQGSFLLSLINRQKPPEPTSEDPS